MTSSFVNECIPIITVSVHSESQYDSSLNLSFPFSTLFSYSDVKVPLISIDLVTGIFSPLMWAACRFPTSGWVNFKKWVKKMAASPGCFSTSLYSLLNTPPLLIDCYAFHSSGSIQNEPLCDRSSCCGLLSNASHITFSTFVSTKPLLILSPDSCKWKLCWFPSLSLPHLFNAMFVLSVAHFLSLYLATVLYSQNPLDVTLRCMAGILLTNIFSVRRMSPLLDFITRVCKLSLLNHTIIAYFHTTEEFTAVTSSVFKDRRISKNTSQYSASPLYRYSSVMFLSAYIFKLFKVQLML